MKNNKHPKSWGYAAIFPQEFVIVKNDQAMNKLVFAATHGFDSADIHLKDIIYRLGVVRRFTEKHRLALTVHTDIDFFTGSPISVRREVTEYIASLNEAARVLPVKLVVICVGPYHRYMAEPSLSLQMERLRTLAPELRDACASLGIRLGIENHADYWTSDLVELCEQVEGLGIFLDTGNCCMVGERPVEACRIAAPYVVGTHFKDHKVWPKLRDGRGLMVEGAALGEGHVGLETIYRDLLSLNPNPESMQMEIELIPDKTIGAHESLARTKNFVTKLCGHKFEPAATIDLGEIEG